MKGQVEVQTPGRTPIGDIVLTREQSIQELRAITEDMEKDLEELGNRCAKKNETTSKTHVDNKKKKGHLKERKKKREEGDNEEDTDEEELSVKDGEKVFMKSRTSKIHYQEIVKKMEYIRGMPPALMIPNDKPGTSVRDQAQ